MPDQTIKRKRFLFVDDDPSFLAAIKQLFEEMAAGTWEVTTAENHAQALASLQRQPADVVVLDLDMPVLDGLQFLRLLTRTHPGQQVAILTGGASEENRKACLESGAALFLQKLIAPEGFAAVFAALDALAGSAPQEGFRGVMRRVGLQEVLQMECLGRKSSILEVFTTKMRGRIYIADGSIVHTESGSLQGEVALYSLLGLRGGEFNLLPFTEPPRRTITGHYEFLLMEAARLSDEGTAFGAETPPVKLAETLPAELAPMEPGAAPLPSHQPAGIREVLLCSGAGEVLYDWACESVEQRVGLLAQIEHQAAQVNTVLPAGRFDRLEVRLVDGRIVCQIQPHMRLFVRSATDLPPA